MKNLTAKNIQKFQTHDGYAWSASFYLDGKKIGTASDQGHGGEVDTRALDKDALKTIEVHAKTLPHFGGKMDIPQDAAMVLETVMWDTLDMRKTKSLLRRKVVAKIPDGIYEWKIPKTSDMVRVMDQVKTKYPTAEILNTMDLEKANRILHPIAEVNAKGEISIA